MIKCALGLGLTFNLANVYESEAPFSSSPRRGEMAQEDEKTVSTRWGSV